MAAAMDPVDLTNDDASDGLDEGDDDLFDLPGLEPLPQQQSKFAPAAASGARAAQPIRFNLSGMSLPAQQSRGGSSAPLEPDEDEDEGLGPFQSVPPRASPAAA